MAALCSSGERFSAVYEITAADEDEARRLAGDVCIEQTVEFPADLVDDPRIRGEVFGRIESLTRSRQSVWRCHVSYAIEIAGDELSQFVNVLFGNTSLKAGHRLVDIGLPPVLERSFPGPRFGVSGLRSLLGVPRRPLLCSAIKPLGLGADALAGMARQMALGGVDVIKDDHGLADQPFCRFEERVARVADAVSRTVAETGKPCLYAPNVTAPLDRIEARIRFAADAGAGALLIAPGLVGFDALRYAAELTDIRLPVLCHPALLGSYTVGAFGMSHRVVYGLLPRIAGADATIFPNPGGRFGFTDGECRDLVDGAREPFGGARPTLPTPAGGMTLDRVPELIQFYGRDVMLLIGGDLHRHGADLADGCRRFATLTEEAERGQRDA